MTNTFIDPNLFGGEYFPERGLPLTNQLWPDGYDISYLLPESFLENKIWQDLLLAIAKTFDELLMQPARSLAYIRLPETQSRVFKALHSGLMAYDVPDEIMTEELYDATNTHLGYYGDAQGRDNFVKFIGWTLDVDLRLSRLWTKDYKKFTLSYGSGKPIWEGGEWYPTTHVGLSYNMESREGLTEDNLRERFYKNAPIELVLKWIAKMHTFYLNLFISIMSFADVTNTFALNGRGELDLNMNIQPMLMLDILNDHAAVNITTAYTGVGLQSQQYMEFRNTTSVDFTIWNNTENLNSDRYIHSRPSLAWQYTGVGVGKWVTDNIGRFNSCNPISGVNIGLKYEKESYNLVRSSANFGDTPWQISVPDGTSIIYTDTFQTNMDKSNGRRYFTNTGTGEIYQDFSADRINYTLQIAYKKSGNTITGKLETIDDIQNVTLIANINSTGSSIGDGWRLFTYNLLTSNNTYLANSKQLRLTLYVTTTELEVFYVGIEPGSRATSFIYTDDCNVGHRAADRAEFFVNNDNNPNLIQGTFGLSFVTSAGNAIIIDQNPLTLFAVHNSQVDFFDETIGRIANLDYNGTTANLLVESDFNTAEFTVTNTSSSTVPMKASLAWQCPIIYNLSTPTNNFKISAGIKTNTITQQFTTFPFPPQRIYISPFDGYINGLLWIPIYADMTTAFNLDW